MPCLLMLVMAARRDEPVEHLRQVLLETRFKFDGTNGAGTAYHMDVY